MTEMRGREIRLTQLSTKDGRLTIESNTKITLNCLNAESFSSEEMLYCNNDIIQRYVKPNDVVNFDDGKVVCIVKETKTDSLVLDVKIGGTIRSRCQIRFIGGQHIHLPVLAKQDLKDL